MKRALTATLVLVVTTPLVTKPRGATDATQPESTARAAVHSAEAAAPTRQGGAGAAGQGGAILTFGNLGKDGGPVLAVIS